MWRVGDRVISMMVLATMAGTSLARDSGQWSKADPQMRQYYEGLRNKNGMQCCKDNDGFDAKWEVRGAEYWVEIEGEFRRVPPTALLDGPNKYGVAKVWYTTRWEGKVLRFAEITCFLRGLES